MKPQDLHLLFIDSLHSQISQLHNVKVYTSDTHGMVVTSLAKEITNSSFSSIHFEIWFVDTIGKIE